MPGLTVLLNEMLIELYSLKINYYWSSWWVHWCVVFSSSFHKQKESKLFIIASIQFNALIKNIELRKNIEQFLAYEKYSVSASVSCWDTRQTFYFITYSFTKYIWSQYTASKWLGLALEVKCLMWHYFCLKGVYDSVQHSLLSLRPYHFNVWATFHPHPFSWGP